MAGTKEMLLGMVYQKEITQLKFHLQHLRRVNVCVTQSAALRGFVVFVELHSTLYRARPVPSNKFGKCARHYSDPCEIDTV